MTNRIVRVHAGIYGMGIYAIMLPSSGFSVAHYLQPLTEKINNIILVRKPHHYPIRKTEQRFKILDKYLRNVSQLNMLQQFWEVCVYIHVRTCMPLHRIYIMPKIRLNVTADYKTV